MARTNVYYHYRRIYKLKLRSQLLKSPSPIYCKNSCLWAKKENHLVIS